MGTAKFDVGTAARVEYDEDNNRFVISTKNAAGTMTNRVRVLGEQDNTDIEIYDDSGSKVASINNDGDISAVDVTASGSVSAGGQYAVVGDDSNAKQVLRRITLTITDGTNAATLKCTVANSWNGDVIAETDNVAKGATTGDFTLAANGSDLRIENAGLSGYVVAAWIGGFADNDCGTVLDFRVIHSGSGDIYIAPYTSAGASVDMTTLVDTGKLALLEIAYITKA